MKYKFLLIASFIVIMDSAFSQNDPVRIEGITQGSSYHITYFDKQNRDFQYDVDSILHDFDKSVSTYDSTSIISRINRNIGNVIVDRYFKDCFNKFQEVSKNTDGAFDATVFPLVNAWGFGPNKKLKVDKQVIDSILKFVGYKMISLNGNTIVKKDPRVSLDFNAFAPGYSVDVISKYLETKGISSYVVEIGGEVFAKGKKPNGDSWNVGIEKPIENLNSENPFKAIVKLENMAVATSGNYRKFIVEDGQKYVHHIDPKTGYPTKNNLLSVSVFAKDCASADAYATGLLVLGLEKSIKFLAGHKELQAYLIYADEKGNYKIVETPGIKKFVTEAE